MNAEKLLKVEATFLLSAAHYGGLPEPKGDEYGIMGRSNVGKSSFVNHVLGNYSLARVSKKPGKTSFANFYKITNQITWVDLPGYGYAKASHKEKKKWSALIRDYCEHRTNLRGLIWLLDIRHVGTQADIEAHRWLCTIGIPLFPVITKGDKLPQSKRTKQAREFKRFFHLNDTPLVYSIKKHSSRAAFWKLFLQWIED